MIKVKKIESQINNKNINIINNQEKKKFEGFSKNKNDMHLNSSFNVGNSISKQNKENLNKTTNENGNFKDISYSPITHRFNQNYENFLNRKPITERKENTLINLSHFDEFNVKIFILFFFSHKYYPYYLLNPI